MLKINSETTRIWTRGRIQYEQVKYNKCVRLPDSGASWIVVPSLPSWFCCRSTGSALTLCERVLLFTPPYTGTFCPMLFLDPSLVGLASPCTCRGRTESPDRALVYLCHMISAKFVFLFFLYVNCFKLGVEIAFNSRSAANHNKINFLKFRLCQKQLSALMSLVLLPAPLGTSRSCLSTVYILKHIRSVEPHALRPRAVACPRPFWTIIQFLFDDASWC